MSAPRANPVARPWARPAASASIPRSTVAQSASPSPARRSRATATASALAGGASERIKDPARVAVTPVSPSAERIAQRIMPVDHSAKPSILAQILKSETVNRALIFTRTKHGADKVVKGLERAGIRAEIQSRATNRANENPTTLAPIVPIIESANGVGARFELNAS